MDKLFNKNFVLLTQGQFVSRLGSQLFMIALVLWIKNATGSATLIGIIGGVTSAVAIALGPICGTFSDRNSRKRIIVITDILNGIVILALGLTALFGSQNISLIVVVIFITSILSSIISSFFGPAISAAIPDLVPKQKLSAANSVGMLSLQISSLIGRGVGGILFTWLGAPILFLINGFTFLFSAFTEMFISIPQKIPEKQLTSRQELQAYKQDMIEGVQYIWQKVGLRNLVIISATLSFFLTPIVLLLPFFVDKFLNLSDQWYGYLLAIYSAGTLLGYAGAALIRFENESRAFSLVTFLVLEAATFGLIAVTRDLIPIIILSIVSGFLSGYVSVNITTILQATTPSQLRGRVFGVLATIEGSISPLAMSFSGIVADLLNQNIPLIYLISSVSMVVITVSMAFFKDFRSFLVFDSRRLLDEGDVVKEIAR